MLREQTSSRWVSDVTYACQVLGHETRLRLVLLLARHAPAGGCRVDELAQALGAPVDVIALHLAVLEDAGIVHRDRRNCPGYYSLDRGMSAYMQRLGS